MGTGRQARDVVLDSSVLVNFLRIGRIDLIGRRSGFRAHLPDVVAREIDPKYPDQQLALENAMQAGDLLACPITDQAEIQLFEQLTRTGRIGAGECATLAVAAVRAYPAGIEDRVAAKVAAAMSLGVSVLKTQDIVVEAIRIGHLSLAEADRMLVEWATRHQFKLRLTSFATLLP